MFLLDVVADEQVVTELDVEELLVGEVLVLGQVVNAPDVDVLLVLELLVEARDVEVLLVPVPVLANNVEGLYSC